MTEKDVLEVLAVGPETRWFLAVCEVLDEQERAAQLQAQAPGTLMHPNAGLILAHCNGGAEWLRATRERLVQVREEQWRRKTAAADAAEPAESPKGRTRSRRRTR